MTAVIVIGIIVFALFVIMFIPVYLSVDYGGELVVLVKYGFIRFTLFPAKPKTDKQKRKGEVKAVKNAEKKAADAAKMPEKQADESLDKDAEKERKREDKALKKQKRGELIETIKMAVECGSDPMLWFFKKIRFRRIYINAVVSGDDAAEAALNYGKFMTLVWGTIGWLMNVVTVRVTDVDVGCDFSAGKSRYDMHGDVGFRLGVFFAVGFWFLINFIKFLNKKK